MDRAARSLMCLFGLKCRRGLDCHCGHTDVEKKLFADRKALREKEWMAPCGFCAVGRCRYGAECQRSIRSRLTNEAYRNHSAPAESESDYESAESGCDSCDDSADEAGLAQSVECGAEAPEGAVPDCALAPFLSEDYTKVVKGWRPNVGSADVGQRGFGEASVYWLLDYVELKPPASAIDQCEVDAIGFVFQKSEGAAMSQKAQRRIAQQKKVEVVWAGPAVVREQRAVSRVPIGHRGATMRKALFEDSDEIDSAEQLPVVDESVSQQRRLESLRKVQLWAWRQQVKDDVGVVKLCFQKWVGGGLAGWFVRNYARRGRQFCRSPTVGERVQAVLETGTDPFPLTQADQAELKLTGGLYPFPNRRLEVSVDDRSFVGVAALRMSAATVLRMVLLRKAVEAAQSSVYVRLKCAFEGWFWWSQEESKLRLDWQIDVLDDLLYPRWWDWTFYPLWRRWTFSVGVRRAERMLCKWGAERVGGATRQWLSNWCSDHEFEEAAMKATAAKRAAEAVKIKAAAMASRVQSAVTDLAIRGATRQWLKKAKAAAWSDFVQWSRWDSVMMQWYEMMDILAELAECKMQKLE
jgi:hypothetical protein